MGNGCFSTSNKDDKEKGDYEEVRDGVKSGAGLNQIGPVHNNLPLEIDKDEDEDDRSIHPYEDLNERHFKRDITSYPSIIQEILRDNVRGLKYMIEKGVDVNMPDADGETPLIKAAVGGHVECLKILLDAGADVNIDDTYGEIALMKAITKDQKDCVDLLITKGVDEISVGKTGDETILMWTAENGEEKYLNYFITLGASVNRPDRHGATALLKAAGNGHLDCMKSLVISGADVNSGDQDGITALMLAAQNGLEECVEWLIKAGADVNAKDRRQDTVLHKATFTGQVNCMEILVKSGANVNAADESGTTPLMLAAHNGIEKCIKWLIMAGADVNAIDKYGHTALKTAILKRHKGCEQTLKVLSVKKQPYANGDKDKSPNNNRDSEVNAESEYETIWNSNEGKENGNDQKMNAKENGMSDPEGKNKIGKTVGGGAHIGDGHPNQPVKGLHMMARDAISSQ